MENRNAPPDPCIVPGCGTAADDNCPLGLCTGCWWWAVDSLSEHQQATATPKAQRRGFVYMVQVGDRIKVGFTTRPKQRFKSYPPGSIVLAYQHDALPIDETDLHGRCAQYRVAGREWYRDSPEMRAIAAEMITKYGEPSKAVIPTWGSGHNHDKQPLGRGRRAERGPRKTLAHVARPIVQGCWLNTRPETRG